MEMSVGLLVAPVVLLQRSYISGGRVQLRPDLPPNSIEEHHLEQLQGLNITIRWLVLSFDDSPRSNPIFTVIPTDPISRITMARRHEKA